MTFKRLSICCALLGGCVFGLVGCEANRYEIVMDPEGGQIQRDLTCWREPLSGEAEEATAFPIEELQRIAGAYGADVPTERAKKHRFSGKFESALPNDIGGAGSYTHWTTSLGSVSAYVERFRGNDDLQQTVESRLAAAARLAELMSAWLASHLDGEPGFAELETFLAVDFQNDMKNMSLYSWAYEVVAQETNSNRPDCVIRVAQYLAERDYFTTDQIPVLARALEESEATGGQRLLDYLQRFVATKMGVAPEAAVPEHLQFLAERETVELSLNEFLRDSEEFAQLVENWERELESHPDATRPVPLNVIANLAAEAFLPGFQLTGPDRLEVKLASEEPPFLTNGVWNDWDHHVSWSRDISPADSKRSEFPTLLFALWSKPNEMAQQVRFGRVILEDESLGQYVMWHRGLTDGEADEWDRFLATMQPDKAGMERLQQFRFSGEAADEEDGLSSTVRELILSQLLPEVEE